MTLRGVIVSFIMTIVLSIMVLGYAALQQRIDIEGEATVDSTYKVQINSVREKSATGDARSTSVFQYNGLSTTFHVGLTNETDTITYEIEVDNLGTVDAILNNTEILIDGSDNMKVIKSGIRNGDILLANSLKVLTITVGLTQSTSSEQTANITINLDYTRLKGGTGEVQEDSYYSELPSTYQELEYLECISVQCVIQFDYLGLRYDKVAIKVSLTSGTSDAGFFGLTNAYELYFKDKKIYTWPWSYISSPQNGMSIEYNTPYDINAEISRDIASEYSTYKGMLFSYRVGQYPFLGRIYYAYIERNGEKIFNFIPALDNNGVPCMYDTVSGETFYNTGTGTFSYQLKQ